MFFDDARLDDALALAGVDEQLRLIASSGPRIRVAAFDAAAALVAAEQLAGRPRALTVLGPEARLVRAVIGTSCPVPLVVWSHDGLPGWVGPLDAVLVLAGQGSDPELVLAVREAIRRGATVVVAASSDSVVAEHVRGRSALLLDVDEADPLATVVVALSALHVMGLAPAIDVEQVAMAADRVAAVCSPHVDLATNPAKELAVALAEAQPLVWGGSVLAARASRRVAEALRRTTGRPALAADAAALSPVVEATGPRDLFDDPFDAPAATRPVLVVLDDGCQDDRVRRDRGELATLCARHGVRRFDVHVSPETATDLERYVDLLVRGLFGACYLGLGLTEEE